MAVTLSIKLRDWRFKSSEVTNILLEYSALGYICLFGTIRSVSVVECINSGVYCGDKLCYCS